MSRNLSARFIRETVAHLNAQLRNSVTLADATIERMPCGYVVTRKIVEFSDDDRAWFRGPIKGGE